MTVTSDPEAARQDEPAWPTESVAPRAASATAVAAPPDAGLGASEPIGRLRHVEPAELWRATDFATWLATHLDVVASLVTTKLTAAPAGAASPGTVVATDPDGAQVRVVVELGPSSDEMFGLLMRQLVASGARTAIWICARARDEHLTSVEWLNREITGKLHVVTVDAVRIDDSVPAPIFRLALRAGGGAVTPSTNGVASPA